MKSPSTPSAIGAAHMSRLQRYWRQPLVMSERDMIDLDLQAAGLIQLLSSPGQISKSHRLVITDLGVELLAGARARRIANAQAHHSLGDRLALWLTESEGRLVWTNTEFKALGVGEGGFDRYVRPDVFSIHPSQNIDRIAPVVHEVKVSRADFLADVALPHKRAAYQAIAGAVFYVAPEGMIEAAEVPNECGLLVERSPGVFVRQKPVRAKRVLLHNWALLNLAIKPPYARPTLDGVLEFPAQRQALASSC